MNRRSALLVLLVALLGVSVAAVASAKLTGIGDSSLTFRAVGPAGMKINGTGSGVSASEKDGKLSIKAPLTNLKTGIGLRDRHLKGYLETDKYPHAILVIERSKLKFPADKNSIKGTATGKLTLHGVTKDQVFTYKAKRTGSDYHVQGLMTLKLTDYGIEVPSYLGVSVDDEVKTKVKFKLREK